MVSKLKKILIVFGEKCADIIEEICCEMASVRKQLKLFDNKKMICKKILIV